MIKKTAIFLTSIFVVTLVTCALRLTSVAMSSFPQNANSSAPTNRGITTAGDQPKAPDFSKATWELPPDADKTKNPVASSDESIAKGSELYMEKTKGNCVFCHGDTGSGNEANLPRLRRKPADLTNKERMAAMTDGELFWKISKGINGIMPAGEKRMSEEERWNVVNFIKTLPAKAAKQ
jgi:mono/diheme cytochrome c family protein